MRRTKRFISHRRSLSKRAILAVALVLALFAGSGIFAWRVGRSGRPEELIVSPPRSTVESNNVSPLSLMPSSPSKEYIYVGGRLVATEEPAP